MTALVDLVQQDHWVLRLRAPKALDDFARHGADLSPPVSLQFGCVLLAAEWYLDKLTPDGFGDALRDGCLADARWSVETQYLPVDSSAEYAYTDELHDPVFDVIHALVVSV